MIDRRKLDVPQSALLCLAEVPQRILDLTAKHALVSASQVLVDYRNVSRPTPIGVGALRELKICLLCFSDSQPPLTPKQHSQSLDEQRLHRGLWFELGNKFFKQVLEDLAPLMSCNEVIA